MALTSAELQSVTSSVLASVLSSIRTNSKTIDQLSVVTSLADDDSFEIGGGKRVRYAVLRDLIASLSTTEQDSLKSLITANQLKSVTITTTESTATLSISSNGKTISTSIPIASTSKAGLMTAADKLKLESTYERVDNIKQEQEADQKTLTSVKAGLDEINNKIGKPNGIAPLDENGILPSRYIPGSYDDVLEFAGIISSDITPQTSSTTKTPEDPGVRVVYNESSNCFLLRDEFGTSSTTGKPTTTYYANWLDADLYGPYSALGRIPQKGKVYVDTTTNKTYRWSGSQLVIIGSDLALGHTPQTAFPGDEGAQLQLDMAAANRQISNNLNAIVANDAKVGIEKIDRIVETRDEVSGLPVGSVAYVKANKVFYSKASDGGLTAVAGSEYNSFYGVEMNSGIARQDKIFRLANVFYRFDGEDLVKIGGAAIGNTYNLTAEVPTPDPDKVFYTLTDEKDKYYAPKVVLEQGKINFGIQITFSIAKGTWKIYQYIGTSLESDEVLKKENWLDLAGMSAGTESIININDICEDIDYTISTALTALINKEEETGVNYRKLGLIITYRRDANENKWETKQYIGSLLEDMLPKNEKLWADFGSGGGGISETTEVIAKDNPLPPTSNAVYEEFQAKAIVDFDDLSDGENYKFQGVNKRGERLGNPITIPRSNGSGQQGGTTLNIYPETSSLWGAFGGRLVLNAAIVSVTYEKDEEIYNTIRTISILDATTGMELWSQAVNSTSSTSARDYRFEFDFTSFFTTAASRDFQIKATDSEGNSKTKTVTVTAVDVICECIQTLNYTTNSTLVVGGPQKSLAMYRFPNNVSTKQGIKVTTDIFYQGEWKKLGDAVVTDTYSHNVSINPTNVFGGGEQLTHGSYPLRIQGEDLASGVKGNIIYTAVMAIDPASDVPVVSLRYNDSNEGKIRLYDSLNLEVAAYTPGKTNTEADVYVDGIKITTVNCAVAQTYAVSKQVQGYANDGSKTIDVYAQSIDSSSVTLTLRIEGSAIDASLKEGAAFAFDMSMRNNSETDHAITDNGVKMDVEGANWNSNGFVDVLGERVLRIAENVKAQINYQPFSSPSLTTTGMAFQMAFSTANVRNKDSKLCECYDPVSGAGFYILGNEVVIALPGGTPERQSVKFKNGEKVTIAVVVEPASKNVTYNGNEGRGTTYAFMKIYVNGEECGIVGYNTTGSIRQSKFVTFDSADGDININYILAYDSYMEWLQAFQNYLVKLTDVNAMVSEFDKEAVLDSSGKPSRSMMEEKGIPYYVIVADQTTFDNFDYAMHSGTDTSDQFACTLYYYNPGHPEVNFKATNVLWRRQGTTSAQRPIKNDRFNFNKKNKQTGLKATVELLNPDSSTELGRKAIEAVKHNKVYVSEKGFFVDIITVKVDFSDSSNANDCGVCNMMNATFRALGSQYMTPAQRAFTGVQDLGDGDTLTGIEMDHSTKNHPVAVFRATRDNLQDAWFHAKGNWKEDKGEQVALGFQNTDGYNKGCLNYGDFVEYFGNKNESLASLESRFKSDNTTDKEKVYLLSQYCGRDYAIYRYKSGSWQKSTGSMKMVNGKWVVTGDVLNPVSGYELLQYAGFDWWQGVSTVEDMMAPSNQKSSWVTKLGFPNETYPAWTYYFECMIDDDQLQEDLALGKKVPYDLFNVLRFLGSCDYSKAEVQSTWRKIWRENAYKYMSIESAMAYTAFTDYLAAVDQRAKNMQPMFFLEDGCSVENGVYTGAKGMEPVRMYLNKIYDCDTCNGADNDGGRDIDPETDPNKPTDEATGYENPYMGSGSVLFNNMDKESEVWNSDDNGQTTLSLKAVVTRMRGLSAVIDGKTMAPFSPDGALYFFKTKILDFWQKVISSIDGERKYIDHTNIANMPYFYALHGLGLTSLPRFIEQRWAIRDGYYQCGDFFTNPLTGRVSSLSPDSKIHITAGATGYFGIGNDASGQLSEVVFLEKGQSHSFTQFAHDTGALLYIYQPGRMSKIDLSEMSLAFHFNDLSKLVLAEEIILGGSKHTSNPAIPGYTSLGAIVCGDLPFLRKLDVSGTTVTGINAKGCPRIEEIDASNSPLTSCDIAQTAPINSLKLPEGISELKLQNLPNLVYPGGLEFGSGRNIATLMVEGCPGINAPELMLSLIDVAPIRRIRVTGLDVTASSNLLRRLMTNGVTGLDENGNPYEETSRCSGLIGRWVMDDLIAEDLLAELGNYFVTLELHNMRYTKVTFSDDASDVTNISNEHNKTGYKYSNTYVPSGHVLRLRDTAPICACRVVGGKMQARPLSNDTLLQYRNGTVFDPTDAVGSGTDVMKYIPHYWYKGVNDFARSEKLFFVSANAEKPVSTATKVVETNILNTIDQREYALMTSQNIVGAEPVMTTNSATHVCRLRIDAGMKLVRWPGQNASTICTVFLGADGRIIKTTSFSNSLSDFVNGDYLIAEIPEGTREILMTVPKGYDTTKIIVTDSSDKESVVPEWFRHYPELIGVYHSSVDGLNQVRSVSGAPIRNGTGSSVTSSEWQYDGDGNVTSMSAPTTLQWTGKDFSNAAAVRGKGYQLQDYESWKDFANLVYAITGTRDTQGLCGMGGSQNAYATGGYDTDNPNGFSSYPSPGGSPFKGNNVWGLQNYMSAGAEWIDNVAMNIASWENYKRNRSAGVSGDVVDYKWHIWNADEGIERVVQGVSSSSGYCIGKMRWGDRCDIVPSQMTGDNTLWNKHYTDFYTLGTSTGRAVFRGVANNNSAGAVAGLVGASANNASSYSNSYLGARLAFRGEIEYIE